MVRQGEISEQPEVSSVLGLPIHLLSNYPRWLIERMDRQQGCHVVTLNAEMTMQAERDIYLAKVIQHADLVIPDGAGVVLYLKLQGRTIQRCPGIELAESLLKELGRSPQKSVFFLGGAPGVADNAAEVWRTRAPGLNIVGIQNGYLSNEDLPKLQKDLQELQPSLILVGLGVPRQEFWITEHRRLCPQSVWIGVGGSFDIWAGVKLRAPGWLRNNNLEWVYRLYKEPWRWRRMLDLPKFAWRALVYRLTHSAIR